MQTLSTSSLRFTTARVWLHARDHWSAVGGGGSFSPAQCPTWMARWVHICTQERSWDRGLSWLRMDPGGKHSKGFFCWVSRALKDNKHTWKGFELRWFGWFYFGWQLRKNLWSHPAVIWPDRDCFHRNLCGVPLQVSFFVFLWNQLTSSLVCNLLAE